MKPTISPVGIALSLLILVKLIDPKINRQIRQIIEQIKGLQLDGIVELVPYILCILFNMMQWYILIQIFVEFLNPHCKNR